MVVIDDTSDRYQRRCLDKSNVKNYRDNDTQLHGRLDLITPVPKSERIVNSHSLHRCSKFANLKFVRGDNGLDFE
jgi:hypothetical protein